MRCVAEIGGKQVNQHVPIVLSVRALNLYLRYEDALMDKDVVAAVSVLEELRALRDTMAEWQKLEEDRKRTERIGKGHY